MLSLEKWSRRQEKYRLTQILDCILSVLMLEQEAVGLYSPRSTHSAK